MGLFCVHALSPGFCKVNTLSYLSFPAGLGAGVASPAPLSP